MPILQPVRKINPQEIVEKHIGVALPLNSTNMFKGTLSFKEQVKTNIINVLLTEPGERVNLPTFGMGLKNLLFNQGIDIEIVKENIQTQLSKWVPNVILKNINVDISPDQHQFSFTISYIYSMDGNADSVQLNFS